MDRRNIFETIAKNLDITPTMYKNATEKYEAMSRFLQSAGIKCDIYPQGSFASGTIIRPFEDGKDCDYDIDMVCELTTEKEKTNAQQTKWVVGSPLQNSDLYASKDLKEWDRCWTLSYANLSGDIGFSMDILPSVHECREFITWEKLSGTDSCYAEKSIAITNKDQITKNYSWSQSNPRGYKMWFDAINEPYLSFQRASSRQHLFEENRGFYNSVEEVPPMLERSSLQRVIQILKRHRDMYYHNAKRKKPISAIITTLVAEIAKNASPQLTIFDLLQFVVADLNQYASLNNESHLLFEMSNPTLRRIQNDGSKWTVRNPVNHNDNYTENWIKEDAEFFFRWLKAVRMDFIDNINESDEKFFAALDCGVGKQLRISAIPGSVNFGLYPQVSQTKPWRE